MTAVFTSISVACVASGTAAISVAKPSGVGTGANGLLIAVCESNSTSTTFTVPGTYTNGPFGTSTTGVQVYWRLTTNGESGSESFTRSTTTGNGGVALIYLAPGTFDTGTPIAAVTSVASSATTTMVLPTLTASNNNTLLAQIDMSTATTAQTWTPPGTVTSRSSGTATGTACPYNYGDEVVTAGATGTRTWTHTGSIAQRGAMIAINPLASTGTVHRDRVSGTATASTCTVRVSGTATASTRRVRVGGVAV